MRMMLERRKVPVIHSIYLQKSIWFYSDVVIYNEENSVKFKLIISLSHIDSRYQSLWWSTCLLDFKLEDSQFVSIVKNIWKCPDWGKLSYTTVVEAAWGFLGLLRNSVRGITSVFLKILLIRSTLKWEAWIVLFS